MINNQMGNHPMLLENRSRACLLKPLWTVYTKCLTCNNNQVNSDHILNNKWAFLDHLRWRGNKCLHNITILHLGLINLIIQLWMFNQVLVTLQCLQIWECRLTQKAQILIKCIATINNRTHQCTEEVLLQTIIWLLRDIKINWKSLLWWFNQV